MAARLIPFVVLVSLLIYVTCQTQQHKNGIAWSSRRLVRRPTIIRPVKGDTPEQKPNENNEEIQDLDSQFRKGKTSVADWKTLNEFDAPRRHDNFYKRDEITY